MRAAAPDDELAAEAAQWLVHLRDDETQGNAAALARTRAAFTAWKAADPRHAEAAQRMEALLERVQGLRGQAGGNARPAQAALSAALSTGQQRRRIARAGAVLALAFALAVPAAVTLRAWPPAYLMADLRTHAGEWQDHQLADGTRIALRGGSAVNLRYDAARRTLELVQGDILVDVAKDAARPFVVQTAHGRIRALGTRFVVERQPDATVLSMLESTTEVQPASGGAPLRMHAGERLRFTAAQADAATPLDVTTTEGAWRRHQLVVHDQPLPEVLDALARQRPGHLQYDRAALEGIRVSAVLPLDDTGRALQLLVDSFPQLRVRMLTRYFVMVDTAPQP